MITIHASTYEFVNLIFIIEIAVSQEANIPRKLLYKINKFEFLSDS